MENTLSQNKMGTQPVTKLILTMGIPMIISMIIQAMYNIIDSYFVSLIPDVADQAMNALTLAFPIQMLIIAIGVGTGIGVNALLSQSLGQGNQKMASQTAGNAVFLGICTYIAFLLFAKKNGVEINKWKYKEWLNDRWKITRKVVKCIW